MKIAKIELYLIRSAFVKRMPKAIEISRCEGEVASVQDECEIIDFFGTDDGRGVLSARELSNYYSYSLNDMLIFMIWDIICSYTETICLVRVLMLQPFHRPDLDINYRSFISEAVPLPFPAS